VDSLLLALCLAAGPLAARASAAAWTPPPGLAQVPIWPGTPPGPRPSKTPESYKRDGAVGGAPVGWITDVSTPTMTVYPAQGKNTGAAVIVFPGGGFAGLAIDLEGTEVCDRLAPEGITCVVLKYRVPGSEDYWDDALHRRVVPKVPTAFQDAQRTISLVRARAAEWGVDPRKIGVLGFSAGGYLAAKTAADFRRRSYRPVDAADRESCRPDFSAPLYPGHLWRPRVQSDALRLNPAVRVTREVPPTFLLMAEDDHVDHVEQALTYYRALQKAGAPVEMHLYAAGGHAFGLRPTKDPITRWPALFDAWLRTIGMVPDRPR
jgi:acetyl esterase/lipase